MGFASGFNAGWRMAYAADAAKKSEKDGELRRKADELRIAAAEGDLRRQAQAEADERELRDAGRATSVEAGQQLPATGGGRLFFADPNAAAAVADQEQAIAEMTGQPRGAQLASAAAAGGKIFGDSNAAAAHAQTENTPVSRMSRQADVLGRQGKVGAETALREQIAAARKEGVDRVLDVILSGGDEAAARDAYNSIGKDRFGDGDGIKIVKRYQVERPGYQPIDTAEIEITKGGKTQRIADVFAMRHALGDRALEMAKTGYDAKRQEARDAATDAERVENRGFKERELDLRERQLVSSTAVDAAQIRKLDREGTVPAGTIDPKDLAEGSKYFGERGKELFGLGDSAALGADPKALAEQQRQYNQWRLLSESMLKNTLARGESVSAEEIAQAAFEAQRNPKSRGMMAERGSDGQPTGRQIPVVQFNGRSYAVGPARAAPTSNAPTVANARARGFSEPTSITGSSQLDSGGGRGAQLAAAAAPAPGSVAAKAPTGTRTPEQFRDQLAAIDTQIAGTKAAQEQVGRAMAGVQGDRDKLATLQRQLDELTAQLARQQAARNALVR